MMIWFQDTTTKISSFNIGGLLSDMAQTYVPMIVNIFIGLLIFLVGYIVAKIIYKIILNTLKALKLDKVDDMIRKVDMFKALDFNLPKFLAKLVYYLILLLVLQISVQSMGISSLSNGLNAILAYIPKLMTAAIVFLIGVFIADVIKNALRSTTESLNIKTGKFISDAVFYLLVVIIALMALAQAGIDTTLITNNLTMLIGGVLLAFMIGFGFASKDLMSSMLSSIYVNDSLSVGSEVKIGDVSGKIIEMTSTAVIVKSGERKVSIPMHKLTSEIVEIIS